MDVERQRYEDMLAALMRFVDIVNKEHAHGVCFGGRHRLFPAEIHTIVDIGLNDGISLTRLAEKLEISKPTLSERIRKLVAKGYVMKVKNSADHKAVKLHLTPAGKDAAYHHEIHHREMYRRFKAYFGEDALQRIELFTRTFTELSSFEKQIEDNR
ncbi:hypothetical protein CSA57_00070 [candidate division KSB3 bacterium]|nr:MAG: hypothetical protein CSA57_00070 [candidate division KSB3 bacterium]